MFNHCKQVFINDVDMLLNWIKTCQSPVPNSNQLADQQSRTGIAAARAFAWIAMAIGGLWGLSTFSYALIEQLKIALNIALAVSTFGLGHDVFAMSKNYLDPNFKQQNPANFLDFLIGNQITQENCAREFTKNTYLQPAWMWYYFNRKQSVVNPAVNQPVKPA